MLEKGREARRNDSGLEHKTSLLINCLHKTLGYLYERPSSIQSVHCLVSLCFLNARLSFYYFKILTSFQFYMSTPRQKNKASPGYEVALHVRDHSLFMAGGGLVKMKGGGGSSKILGSSRGFIENMPIGV